jgi:hypothetical protein
MVNTRRRYPGARTRREPELSTGHDRFFYCVVRPAAGERTGSVRTSGRAAGLADRSAGGTAPPARQPPYEKGTPMIRRRAVAVLLAGLALAAAGCSDTQSPAAAPSSGPGAGATADWGTPKDVTAAAQRAGLPMLGQEMLAVHYHAHLDIIVAGKRVTVPAGLGIDEARQLISPLHTHDTTGIVHIESAKEIPFTLGQLFTEWGQPLSRTGVGPVRVAAGQALRVYRNGKLATGDPAALRFGQHDEDVIWVGPRSQTPTVPASYPFPAGL